MIAEDFYLKWLIISKGLDLRAYKQDFKLSLLPIYYFEGKSLDMPSGTLPAQPPAYSIEKE